MSKTTTTLTVVLVTALVGVVLVGSITGISTAQEHPETAEEYFNTLRGMDGLDIFTEYSELETLHTQSLAAVQVGEFTNEKAREIDAVLATIEQFQTAQAQFEDGNYETAFETTDRIERNISALEQRDETLGVLSRLALTRYYEQLGDQLASEAESAENTPREIRLRRMAAQAYRGANSPDQAAEFTRQVEQLTAELDTDREQINATLTEMRSFSDRCTACDSPITALSENGIGLFGMYQTALGIQPQLVDSRQRASRHGLDSRESTLDGQVQQATTYRSSLAIGATLVLVGYGAVISILTILVVSRLFAWKRTYEAAQIDSIVAIGDSNA